MKKFLSAAVLLVMLSSCSFISNIFHKKDKYGCPTDGRNVGAEKILAGNKEAIKAQKKAKFRVNTKGNPKDAKANDGLIPNAEPSGN